MNLLPHPDAPPLSVDRVRARFSPSGHRRTIIDYRVFARGALALPPVDSPRRRDGLWQTTCFELFIGAEEQTDYCEFNFAPSGSWAAYSFDDYRNGMCNLFVEAPKIAGWADVSGYSLRVELDLILPWAASSRVGLSAIIEEADGTKSCWALAHPAGPPDFHHRDCFVIELPPLV